MIQVYTGNGKGKTSAAIGIAIRAVGAGLKVYIAQFCKKGLYSELKALKKLKGIKIEQFGRSGFIKKKPKKKDWILVQHGLQRIKEVIAKKSYDMIILDEINIALHLGLLKVSDLIDTIKLASKDTEIILTGRYAPSKIIEIADLVSKIEELKHYYKKGVKARKGIDY
ncbi:MAG: cob(I)yrinic acid a,c-diamide adenosyltransferase [Candidatus Omnitrophica bacterium]|nr:cob(I)yrinic acid a,c-diamide adenosyltransferase [Candidatus Omnitrophota bacterium]